MDSFHIFYKWSLAWEGVSHVMTFWPWPISSRSFDLDFENRVCFVTFSVLDRLFPYLPQLITIIRGCVTCEVYNKILKFQFFANFSAFTLFWLGIWYELVNSMDLGFKTNWSIVWIIIGQRGVSSERRRSSCSSLVNYLKLIDIYMWQNKPRHCILD